VKLRAIFSGIEKGDVCTGTIMRHGLQSSRLKALGYITEKLGHWVFMGFGKART
jgi:hypothetical protein